MKKISILLLLLPYLLSAQYYPFEYNDLYGVVDKEGVEVTKPSFSYINTQIKNIAIFSYKSKKVYYNLIDGTQKEFDDYDVDEVYIKNEYFSLVTENKKQYLKGQTSSKIIPLKSFYTSFKNLGPKYILATGYSKKVISEDKRNEKGELQFPEIYKEPSINYYVFDHSFELNFVAKLNKETIEDKATITTYKLEEKEQIIRDLNFNNVTINLWDHFQYEDFAILAFQNKELITLYDANLKPFKTFTYKGERYELEEKVAEISKKEIKDAKYPIYPSMLMDEDPDYKAPFLITYSDSIYTLSYLKNQEYVLFLKTTSKIKNWSKDKFQFKDSKENELIASIDFKNKIVHIPNSLVKQFEITLLE